MRALRSLFLSLAVMCPAFAWAQSVPAPALKVVATFSILGDLVRNVGGDKVDVSVLVGPDGDAHTFEPTPQESIALSQARLIFENGFHFEHWLDGLYASSGSQALRVVVTDGVEPIMRGAEEDPHVWHDVSNVMVMVERIKEALVAADETNAGYYVENTEKYLAQLGTLNHLIIDTLKNIPDENRKLVTSHDTFGYFAKRYGFTIIGAAIESATTEAADPSAAQIAQLVEKIKSSGVRTVFAENADNPKLLQAVAKEAGVSMAPPVYADALGPAGSEGDTYIKMMEYNARIFADLEYG